MDYKNRELQVQVAADREQSIRNFLYLDGDKNRDFPSMKKFLATLTSAQKDELRTLLRQQVEAQKNLSIPPQYISFLNELHKIVSEEIGKSGYVQEKLDLWQKIALDFVDMETGVLKRDERSEGYLYTSPELLSGLTDKGRAHLDKTGLTYEVELHLMQLAAQKVYEAWQKILGESDELKVTKVLACNPNDKFPDEEFSLKFDVINNRIYPYYKAGRWQIGMTDPRNLFDIAVHEPEHAFQERIKGFGVRTIPEQYREACSLMRSAFQKITGICSVQAFFGSKDEEIRTLFLENYYTRPIEVTAFYQGLMMSLAISKQLGIPASSKAIEWFVKRPELAEQLPKSLIEMIPTAQKSEEKIKKLSGLQHKTFT